MNELVIKKLALVFKLQRTTVDTNISVTVLQVIGDPHNILYNYELC